MFFNVKKLKYTTNHKALQVLYGIYQNPDAGNYILVLLWTSGDEKNDDFIQEKQLKVNNYNNIPLEWIPYNQFNKVKETGKNGLITVYSAIWKDGPFYKKYILSNYTRDSNKKVALKCLHNSQESIGCLINEAEKYLVDKDAFFVLYGISQNPVTNNYILVQNDFINLVNWISGNEKIDNFIQERQLKINNYDNIKNGPLYYHYSEYTRDSNKKVALKCLHNSQESIDSLINEAKKYPIKQKAFQVLYGISQNPDTGDYIFIQNDYHTCISGNEKINNFIQNRQLKIINYNDIVLEWIPYNQFDEIKEIGKNGFITVYSAIWKDGPLHYQYGEYTRDSNKNAERYFTDKDVFFVLYGISQNPVTNDYVLVQNDSINLVNWTSGNEKIDDFIQERQLKINNYDDIVLEWIPSL
ncbi:kinase-like domain-containing protein [Rhizophagus irregularis DAOM 181602=DAOM 197198]|nr:kinase-like domain-containing protein [Rhizophagus irregularis DAOM 181602=DAOM 197198]